MKKFSQDGKLSEDVMLAIMSEEKKSDLDKVTSVSYTHLDVYKRQELSRLKLAASAKFTELK